MLRAPGERSQAAIFAILVLILGGTAAAYGSAVAYGVTPALAGVGLTAVGWRLRWPRADGLGLANVRPGWRISAVAVLVPTLVMVGGAAAAIAIGLGGIALPEGTSLPAVVLAWVVLVLIGTVAALGEEIGWRGYLAVRLKQYPAGRAGLATGLLWAAWHLPLIVVLGSHQAPVTVPGLTLFGLMLIGLGIFLNELRRVTGSVWPAALAHGAHNATWGLLLVLVTHAQGSFEYVGPQAGVVPTLAYVLVAIAILARRTR